MPPPQRTRPETTPPRPARWVFFLAVAWTASGWCETLAEEIAGKRPIESCDVVLSQGGLLQGRIPLPTTSSEKPLSRTVLLLDGRNKPVAATTDSKGRFAFRGVRPGVYQLRAHDGSVPCICRTWSRGAAPPQATGTLVWNPYNVTVRGQFPVPFTNFRNTVAVGGLLGGAIAAPIIYNNAKNQNKVPTPASP